MSAILARSSFEHAGDPLGRPLLPSSPLAGVKAALTLASGGADGSVTACFVGDLVASAQIGLGDGEDFAFKRGEIGDAAIARSLWRPLQLDDRGVDDRLEALLAEITTAPSITSSDSSCAS